MKSAQSQAAADSLPGTAALAALRAWYAGLSAREAVAQYLGHDRATGQSSRAMLGAIRRQLAGYASGTATIWPICCSIRQQIVVNTLAPS